MFRPTVQEGQTVAPSQLPLAARRLDGVSKRKTYPLGYRRGNGHFRLRFPASRTLVRTSVDWQYVCHLCCLRRR